MFAPYNSTGHRMAQALLKPHVQQFIDFTTQNMGVARQYRAGARLSEKLLRRCHHRRHAVAERNGLDRFSDSQGRGKNGIQSPVRYLGSP